MQNMNYYYDFSGQKYNHPLSLSMNSFDRKVFSRQTSLELAFVLKGSYELITEHLSDTLHEEDLVLIAPNDIHILKKSDPESVILILHIDFNRIPENLLGACENVFFTNVCNRTTNASLFFALKETLRKLLLLLLDNDCHTGPDIFELNELMMRILRITKNGQRHSFEQLPVASLHHENYIQAIRYIDQHYEEPIRLADIAKTLSFSTSYTSRLFHRFTGLPFVKYLSYVRVRESLEDLLECKLSIEELSAKCGMPNSKLYTQSFKELYGIPPSTYRKRFLKDLSPLPENETRPMTFNEAQRALLNNVFGLQRTTECLYHSEGLTIEKCDDKIVCTFPKNDSHSFQYEQQGTHVSLQLTYC